MRNKQLVNGNWQLVVLTICQLLAANCVYAASIKIYVSNGTGFFITGNGYAITNEHVLPNCQRLMVDGVFGTREAKIVARDRANDLALIKVDGMITPRGTFSTLKVPIATGDRAIIVGYPGASSTPVTRDSEITRTSVPGGGNRWLALRNVLEHGNSGGPLLDTSGNIIGVVSAKAQLLTINTQTKAEIAREDLGAAITVPVVEKFLQKNGVRYQTADTDIYLPTEHIATNAREYVVKVRCEYQTELR